MLRLCSAHTAAGVQLCEPHLARSARRDRHIKCRDAWLQLRRAHLLERRQCPFPLQRLAAGRLRADAGCSGQQQVTWAACRSPLAPVKTGSSLQTTEDFATWPDKLQACMYACSRSRLGQRPSLPASASSHRACSTVSTPSPTRRVNRCAPANISNGSFLPCTHAGGLGHSDHQPPFANAGQSTLICL